MKKHKLISMFIMSLSAVSFIPVVAARCGKTYSDGQINTEENKQIALTNIKDLGLQTTYVYIEAIDAITYLIEENKVSDQEKEALEIIKNVFSDESTKTNNEGELRKKINLLNIKSNDYLSKLLEIKTDWTKSYENLKVAYVGFRKKLDSNLDDKILQNEFDNLSELKTFFPQNSFFDSNDQYQTDLAKRIEIDALDIRQTALKNFETSTQNNTIKVKNLGKQLSQILHLITKHRLQAIVIAELLEKNDLNKKELLDSFKKHEQLSKNRIGLATLPNGFVEKIYDIGLKIKSLASAFKLVDEKKSQMGVTALASENEKKYEDSKSLFSRLNIIFEGDSSENINPNFPKESMYGLKKNIDILNKTFIEISKLDLMSLRDSNKISDLSSNSSVNSIWANIKITSGDVISGSISNTILEVSRSVTSTEEKDVEFKNELVKLASLAASLKEQFSLIRQKENNQNSILTVIQKTNIIRSTYQILLLQAAIDILKIDPKFISFELIK